MAYVYSINSIGLNIVYFASRRAAYKYAERHNIRMSDGKIRTVRCRSEIAKLVREDFNEAKKIRAEVHEANKEN